MCKNEGKKLTQSMAPIYLIHRGKIHLLEGKSRDGVRQSDETINALQELHLEINIITPSAEVTVLNWM